MSSYGYPCFVEGESSTSSSFQRSPYPDYYRDMMSFQNQSQNPIHANHETLEDAFARLSVVPNNHAFVAEGSGFNGAAKRFYYDGRGSSDYRSNIGQMQRLVSYNGNDAVARFPPPNGSYDSLMSQKEPHRFLLPRLPFSNDDLCYGFQRKPRGGVTSNEFLNAELLNANNRGYRLLQQTLQKPLTQCCVYDLKGKILALAKDQVGCRILQEKMKSLNSQEEVSFVFSELIGSVIELMLDPSGNYVFQKLVEICNEEQRTRIILMVTNNNFQLVNICLDAHGYGTIARSLCLSMIFGLFRF